MDPRYTWGTWHGPALQQGWRHPSHQVVEELPVEKPVEQELVRPQCWRNCGCHQVCGCTSALYTFPIFQKFLIWLLLLPSRCVIGFLLCEKRSNGQLHLVEFFGFAVLDSDQASNLSFIYGLFFCKTCCLTSGSNMAGIVCGFPEACEQSSWLASAWQVSV